tara:strand:- start:6 stop:311 length:306 start_codon:yes stop_codon:yes gene_type:complete
MGKVFVDNVLREATAKEQSEWDNFLATQNTPSKKLQKIKQLRIEFLVETDWWVFRGEMTSEQTAWRKSLRDIPQNYSEDKYDELLARDEQGNLTHSVWSKP